MTASSPIFCANAFSRTGYTFASPFAIAAGDMEKYFGAGAKVRQLESTSVAENVLTLNFTDATDPIYDGNSSNL